MEWGNMRTSVNSAGKQGVGNDDNVKYGEKEVLCKERVVPRGIHPRQLDGSYNKSRTFGIANNSSKFPQSFAT